MNNPMNPTPTAQRLSDYCGENRLIRAGESRLLVAFSGGADSTALLDFLWENREKLGLQAVAAAHYNHRLRGAESDRDEAFCRAFCTERGIPFFVGSGDVTACAKRRGRGIEEAARSLRYAFLRQTATTFGVGQPTLIATAHNADDNLETMLLNLARGSGPEGLCGIAPRRGNLIRPLLCLEKSEILDYCRRRGLSFVTDSTNNDEHYARNRIRAQVLPALRAVNPAAAAHALRTAALLRDDVAEWNRQADELLRRAVEKVHGTDILRADVLSAAPPPVRCRALTVFLRGFGCEPTSAERGAVTALLQKGSGHLRVSGRTLSLCKGRLSVADLTETRPETRPELTVTVPADGRYVGFMEKSLRIYPLKSTENVQNLFYSCLRYDTIKGTLAVRTRRAGDRFQPARSGCTQTVKKLFNEKGVPPAQRDRLLILQDDEGIVFVEGFGAARRTAPAADAPLLRVDISPRTDSKSSQE